MNVTNAASNCSKHGISQSEKTTEIAKSLLKLQSEMSIVSKGTDNTFFKSKYASLPDIWKVLQPCLERNGLLITQAQVGKREVQADRVVKPGKYDKEKVYQEFRETVFMVDFLTRITHVESGEFIESIGTFSTTEPDVQSDGSLITYARRYCLCSMLCVMVDDEDDDGNSASGRMHQADAPQNGQPKPQSQKPEPPPVQEPTSEERVKKFLHSTGCQDKKDAEMVLDFIAPGNTLETIKEESVAAVVLKVITDGVKEKTLIPENVLEEAKTQSTAAAAAAAFPV